MRVATLAQLHEDDGGGVWGGRVGEGEYLRDFEKCRGAGTEEDGEPRGDEEGCGTGGGDVLERWVRRRRRRRRRRRARHLKVSKQNRRAGGALQHLQRVRPLAIGTHATSKVLCLLSQLH